MQAIRRLLSGAGLCRVLPLDVVPRSDLWVSKARFGGRPELPLDCSAHAPTLIAAFLEALGFN